MFKRVQQIVGICFTNHSMVVTALELKGKNKKPVLKNKTAIAIPPDAFQDGLVLNRDLLTGILADNVREHGLKGRMAVIGVNPRQAVIKAVVLPPMPEKDLRKAIEFEMGRYFSITNAAFTIDYLHHITALNGQANEGEVLAIAIKDSVLEDLCGMLLEAGLKIKAVDIEPNAFVYLRTYGASQNIWPDLEENWAIIDFSYGKTMIAFYKRNVLQFVHTTPLFYGVDYGLSGDLLQEIDRAFNYYQLSLHYPPPERVYLWGELSEQALPFLQEALRYPFLCIPLQELAPALHDSTKPLLQEYALALGLVLREVV